MAVAELCIGSRGWCLLAIAVATKRVILVRNVLCEIRCDHLLDLLGLARGSLFSVLYAFAVQVSRPLGEALMVVAMHQGGVGIG